MNVIKKMSRYKVGGIYGQSIVLFKNVLKKFAAIFTKCLQTSSKYLEKYHYTTNSHKKGDIKDLRSIYPIIVLSVVYKLFKRVLMNRISATLD